MLTLYLLMTSGDPFKIYQVLKRKMTGVSIIFPFHASPCKILAFCNKTSTAKNIIKWVFVVSFMSGQRSIMRVDLVILTLNT